MCEETISVIRKAGDKGNLFGSVTALDVAEKLLAQGYHIDKRKIHLASPIKVLGEYTVPIRLHREVNATVKVLVEPDAETKAKMEAAAAEAQAQTKASAKAAPAPAASVEAPPSDTTEAAPTSE